MPHDQLSSEDLVVAAVSLPASCHSTVAYFNHKDEASERRPVASEPPGSGGPGVRGPAVASCTDFP